MAGMAGLAAALASGMVLVGPGVLERREASKPTKEVAVPAFQLDRLPVTNAEFLAFAIATPEWRRDRAPHLFVDERYLSRWESPSSLGVDADPEAPVVFVSWFAARAYCASRGARLPTVDEWELAAQASETSPRGDRDPEWRQRVLDWYAKPTPPRLPRVGHGKPNFWKVFDLHGLVWEWVFDFNSELVEGGGRGASSQFCGGGALEGTADDYAAFMRKAFRSSLRARYTAASLGFRCAVDAPKGKR
ncbi:MAG: formylglycine-generating enzyme family protein [Polyangiaceae bacterium]